MAVEIRRFEWHKLPPEHGEQMLTLVRSLGLDPDYVAVDFALTRRDNGPWTLHLTEMERDENGAHVADVAAQQPASRPVVRQIEPPAFLLTTSTEETHRG